MKTFVRLIWRYVLAAVSIVLLLVFLGLGLLMFLGWQETTHLPQRTYASSEIADAMVETPAGLALGAAHTPEEWMDGYAWAMVLDDTGNIRWNYALPDALNHAYTTGEVAVKRFSSGRPMKRNGRRFVGGFWTIIRCSAGQKTMACSSSGLPEGVCGNTAFTPRRSTS
mgnify:CR=1 FL=1